MIRGESTLLAKRITAFALALGLFVSFQNPAVAAVSDVDNNVPMVGVLKPCVSSDELDCVESISTVVAGVETELTDGTFVAGPDTEMNGNVVKEGSINYPYQSSSISLRVELESKAHIIDPTFNAIGAALRAHVHGLDSNDKTIFKLVIRTSWLQAQDVQLLADDADFGVEAIEGGQRWTLSGSQQRISGYSDNWQTKMASEAKADWDIDRLAFFIHHQGVDAGHSYFETDCVDGIGYPVRSFNAPAAGLPSWDPASQSVNFGIESPHFTSTGKVVSGYFRLWVPAAWLDCKWPTNTVSGSTDLTVVVLDTDGQRQLATTSVSRADGWIRVVAKGFHFSSPVIKLMSAKKILKKSFSLQVKSFASGKSTLSTASKNSVKASVKRYLGNKRVTCVGNYGGKVTKTLALARAKSTCAFAKSYNAYLTTAVTALKTVASSAGTVKVSSW